MTVPSQVGSSPFQFTHPGRGATQVIKFKEAEVKFQFTHPGRGATTITY